MADCEAATVAPATVIAPYLPFRPIPYSAKQHVIALADGDRIVLHFGGKNRGLMKDISVQDGQWIASLLSQLSDRQLRDAFRAANYTAAQINLLAGAVRERTNELLSLRPSVQIGRSE